MGWSFPLRAIQWSLPFCSLQVCRSIQVVMSLRGCRGSTSVLYEPRLGTHVSDPFKEGKGPDFKSCKEGKVPYLRSLLRKFLLPRTLLGAPRKNPSERPEARQIRLGHGLFGEQRDRGQADLAWAPGVLGCPDFLNKGLKSYPSYGHI